MGGILGDDKNNYMMGGSSAGNNPLKKIYSNQSSHKTISWYIQDNHTIVSYLTNKKNLQKQKNQINQKPLTKNIGNIKKIYDSYESYVFKN